MMILLLVALLKINENSVTAAYASWWPGNLGSNACGMYDHDGTADAFGDWSYAAVGGDRFDDGYGCGRCYIVRCTGAYGNNPCCSCDASKTLTIQAIDECGSCVGDTTFDLNKQAFTYFTGSNTSISVEYQRVDCSAITTNFKVTNKEGTSQGWYAFRLEDVNDDGGIRYVELLKDGNYIATCDKSGGSSLSASTPLDIKITSRLFQILMNIGSNYWWMAIEFPNINANSTITNLEFKDSNHGSWISGTYEEWGDGAYSFTDGTQFNGSIHFRVTTSSGTAETYGVFSGISPGETAYINLN